MSSPATRRPAVSREEGRRHILEATVALLFERSPERLTIREIAERSGHHHRFVSEWFGSKAGLYREAIPLMLSTVMSGSEEGWIAGAAFRPELRSAVAVLGWVMDRAPHLLLDDPPRLLPERVQSFYEQLGVDPATARMLAQRLMSMAMGASLFGPLLGATEEELATHLELELRIAGFLAAPSQDVQR